MNYGLKFTLKWKTFSFVHISKLLLCLNKKKWLHDGMYKMYFSLSLSHTHTYKNSTLLFGITQSMNNLSEQPCGCTNWYSLIECDVRRRFGLPKGVKEKYNDKHNKNGKHWKKKEDVWCCKEKRRRRVSIIESVPSQWCACDVTFVLNGHLVNDFIRWMLRRMEKKRVKL